MDRQFQSLGTLVLIFTIVLLLIIPFVVIMAFRYQRRQRKHTLEKSELQSQFSQILLQTQLEIQEQTLKNISQEIHDNIGQVLSLAKLNLGTMDVEQPQKLQQKIEDSKNLVGKAIQDLRDLSKSLDADYIKERGLLKSIEYELDMIRKTGFYETILNTTGNLYKLDAQKDLILFRIVQEVLNNIIKHAKASMIIVHVRYQPTDFFVEINDNGEGFDLTPLKDGGQNNFGLGIRNMHNRAKLIGAVFSISSAIGKGTDVIIHLPLIPDSAKAE